LELCNNAPGRCGCIRHLG